MDTAKGQEVGILKKNNLFQCPMSIHKNEYFEVFSASLGRVIANQNACAELVVKKRRWDVDFQKGTIMFGNTDEYPVQFIGSESRISNTWQWGWANESVPETMKIEAKRLRQLGERMRLEAFTTPLFDLDENYYGHKLAVISCALSKQNVCYYRGPHDRGAIFVTFSKLPEAVFAPVSAPVFSSTTMQVIGQFDVDHRIFITSFLYQNHTDYDWDGAMITAHFKNGGDLCIGFEKAGDLWRMISIKSV